MKNTKKAAMAVAIATVAGYGVYTSQKSKEMSEFSMANVEALATCESVSYTTYYMSHNAENGCFCFHCSEPNTPECNCR